MKLVRKYKWFIFLLSLIFFFWIYHALEELCENEPSCACKSAQPGDVTCLGPEQLEKWCQAQMDREKIRQCNMDVPK